MLNVIDMFSGAGGLSLGAIKAGFNLMGAVELDPITSKTHQINFPIVKHLQFDISQLNGNDLLSYFKIKPGELTGIIGGPPCQGFSSIGKRDINDPRNALFQHFFRIVSLAQPAFFLAENVPGILHTRFDSIRQDALNLLPSIYKTLPPVILNAHDYGAPTSRSRVFFIGYNKCKIGCLTPEHFDPSKNTKLNYVKDAFEGLPQKVNHIEVKNKENYWHKIVKPVPGSYAELLSKPIRNVGYEEAIIRYDKKAEVTGIIGTRHSKEVINRYIDTNPGEVDPISRSYKLDLDGVCPTLRAGTDRNYGSFQAVRPLHPTEGRVITPREAARLQGFPDWFVFHHTKWHSFRQIGNSVSPVIAECILKVIINEL